MGEVVDVLLAAKDRIIDGWVPHAPRRHGEVCAAAAIFREDAQWSVEIDALDLLQQTIGTGITVWNDAQTDKQVVIDAFDAAIRLAKEREL